MSVLVIGSVALDNVKTPFGEVENALGGSCSYASMSASYFAPTKIVGIVGKDFSADHVSLLNTHNIDTSALEVHETESTFKWTGYYEYDMNQAHTVDTALNAFATFSPKIPDSQKDTPFVMLGNLDPVLQLQVLEQMTSPKLVMADTMNYWISSKKDELTEVFKRCDIVLLNDAEARQFSGSVSLQKAAKDIMNLGVSRVIIKKGEHGCLMFSRDDFFSAPAFPLEVVKDPTGAGDTFAGGFIGYLAGAQNLDENTYRQAIIAGTTMASFTVEDFSLNRIGNLEASEIKNRCALLRRHTEFPEITMNLTV